MALSEDLFIYTSLNDFIGSKVKLPCGAALRSLLGQARTCAGKRRLVSVPEFEGHHVSFKVQCETDPSHIHHISNADSTRILGTQLASGTGIKKNSGVLPINMRSVFAHTYAGHDKTSVGLFETLMLGYNMHGSQFERLQQKIWEVVTLEFKESTKEVEELIKKTGEWSLQSDTGWGSRGHTALHGSSPFIWHEGQLVILHIVAEKERLRSGETQHEGSYSGSSGGMEGAALRQALRELHDRGILQMCKNIIMDKDSTSSKIISESPLCKHITIRYDPGHAKKNFINQLLKVSLSL